METYSIEATGMNKTWKNQDQAPFPVSFIVYPETTNSPTPTFHPVAQESFSLSLLRFSL
jgi:hypothetical protein